MDLVLHVLDEYLLDKVYARLVPVSAFAGSVDANMLTSAASLNASHPLLSSSASTWSYLVSHLPHPPLPSELLLSPVVSDIPPLSAWPRDYILRQLISLSAFTFIGIHILYFLFAGISYAFIFNHEMMKHPRFLKNQVKLEIMTSLKAFPAMIALTIPWFLAEVRGYSNMYGDVSEHGWPYFFFSIFFFLAFTDYAIYWIHRWEHHPSVYKWLHKPHHKWLIPTPFASFAFHPLDGYFQSIPYHLFPFLFPLHQKLYLGLFVFVNCWTVLIHDSDMITGHPLETVINGPAHHTLHHLYFTVNYGQYFTFSDRWGGSYRQPLSELDPMLEIKKLEAEKKKQA
ncbi:sterol desaturase family protein [Phanerochaete sordida]|uniref:Sterol desaturase family protein n=1 Tax=Phanerochaete sordida TaxID=48140 RepID=A0A9P3LGT7_9APHY|nr:sterol desaturase family protein [Phanerochaete sordida]